jgi:hypothetical protein
MYDEAKSGNFDHKRLPQDLQWSFLCKDRLESILGISQGVHRWHDLTPYRIIE